MKALICYVAWLDKYRGPSAKDPAIWKDKPWQNGIYNEDYYLGECHLFEPCQPKGGGKQFFGDVQGTINVANLGGDRQDGYADRALVIWCSKNPNNGRLQIVGFYKNARVYHEHQKRMYNRLTSTDWKRLTANRNWNSNIECKVADGIFLPVKDRPDAPSLVTRSTGGWSGTSLFRYIEFSGSVDLFVDKLIRSSDKISESDDPIRRAKREISQRQGQGPFRSKVLKAYGGRCAITGCETKAVLDACHILGVSDSAATHSVKNGLLLRTDLHTLFDLDLLCINPKDYTIWVSETLDETYQKLSRKTMMLPSNPNHHPAVDQLKVRWCRRAAS